MKRNKNLRVRPLDAASLDLAGTRVAIVGGTGGIGRAMSCYMATRGAELLVVGRTFRPGQASTPSPEALSKSPVADRSPLRLR